MLQKADNHLSLKLKLLIIERILKILLALLFLQGSFCFASDDTTRVNKTRLIALAAGVNSVYAGSLIYLSEVWYSDQQKTSFHFFNDASQWMLMDKAGHATTAFHESRFGIAALKWAGVPDDKAVLWGSLTGFVYQTPIEILDGHAADYGASWIDVAANATGSALVLSQHVLWDEIRIQPKFSFHRTKWAGHRPKVLGNGIWEETLKDYNGQTYWLSANLWSFTRSEFIPKWLNISFGYSINEMVYARPDQNSQMGYSAYPQFFLSFDFDFEHVPVEKKWLKVLLYPLNFIHIPFPALQVSREGLNFHPLYF